MAEGKSFGTLTRLWRYYSAGVVNSLFGYGLFSLLVTVGLNIYVAQLLSHCVGVAFNWLTYSRFAFSDREGSRGRFVMSYVVNYFLGLGALFLASRLVSSPYLAGLIAIVAVSVINYFVLKQFVYRERNQAT